MMIRNFVSYFNTKEIRIDYVIRTSEQSMPFIYVMIESDLTSQVIRISVFVIHLRKLVCIYVFG